MNKIRKVVASPFFAVGAFALAAVLLLSAGIGGASAALNDTSDVYQLNIDTENIGVQVMEQGADNKDIERTVVKSENRGTSADSYALQFQNVPDDYALDTAYPEVLSVRNTGDIPEYVRVVVYKYWTDANGNKLTTFDETTKELVLSQAIKDLTEEEREGISPDLIELNFVTGDNGWSIYNQTAERTILNYSEVVQPGKSTSAFTDTITIGGAVADYITSTTTPSTRVETIDGKDYTVIGTETTYTYILGDINFVVEVEADAVQTHNAADAMRSAWGYSILG